MNDWRNQMLSQQVLLLLSQASGALLLVSVVWLLNNRRIYLDRDTKQPIEFEFPVLGKLKTQNPVLAMILVAAGLIVYPISASRTDQVTVNGFVETDGKPVTVTIVPMPLLQQTFQSTSPVKMQVPVLPDVNYRALFSVDRRIESDTAVDLEQRKLADFRYSSPTAFTPPVTPKKEVSDAELLRLGIR